MDTQSSSRSGHHRQVWLLVLCLLLILATIGLAWTETQDFVKALSSPVAGIAGTIVENNPDVWARFAILFACEILGVLASFYVVKTAFKPDVRTILLAVLVALVNFGTLYSQHAEVEQLAPVHFLAFFKDGFFWFTALPALARVLGINALPEKQ